MKVWYIDGSPYARIIRATLLEFGVEHDAIELPGYPPGGVEEISPALQVPVLETEPGNRLFGSELIRSYVHETHGRAGDLAPALSRPEARWHDLQVLTAIQSLTAGLVTYFHFNWANYSVPPENPLGSDPVARELVRADALLDWLEEQAGPEGFRPDGFSAQDMALAAVILWTEARDPVDWRGRPRLERIVERADARDSFQRTAPRPWPDSPKGRLETANPRAARPDRCSED